MSSDPNDRPDPSDFADDRAEPAETSEASPDSPAAPEPPAADDRAVPSEPPPESEVEQPSPDESAGSDSAEPASPTRPRRRILIGSQRDAAAYRPKPSWEAIRIVGTKRKPEKREKTEKAPPESAQEPHQEPSQPPPASDSPSARRESPQVDEPARPPVETSAGAEDPRTTAEPPRTATEEPHATAEQPHVAAGVEDPRAAAVEEFTPAGEVAEPAPPVDKPLEGKKFPPPNIRDRLPPDLEAEFQQALADAPLEDLMTTGEAITKQPTLEADTRHTGRVLMIRREDVFVELGGREQGLLALKQFDEPPEVGSEVEVRVVRFNREDGLYELARSGAAASIGDWSDLEEGMLVEARVTGHNTGGLECDVNHIRGFIPVSQVSLYRVEDLSEFVDQKLTCLVTEANPRRRNLVLSRRAVLEREREEARRNLLDSLEPGQVHEGVVRKLVDFGAFVDLGGVDGLLHVSQLAWGRVGHPREVLHEGQHLNVKIESVDKEAGRISLAYRDLLENPWSDVATKYPITGTVHGKVTKLMEYGAFVELEPGVEGLVHVSQLSHKRVWRVSDVVKEGDEVDAVVLSIDPEAQRISLSMKELLEEPKPAEKQEPSEPEAPAPAPKKQSKKPTKPLQGGLGRSRGGEKFGLKW
jgi:small subunit ribosomal protein S1